MLTFGARVSPMRIPSGGGTVVVVAPSAIVGVLHECVELDSFGEDIGDPEVVYENTWLSAIEEDVSLVETDEDSPIDEINDRSGMC